MTVQSAIDLGYITGCLDDKGKVHLRMLKRLKSKNSIKIPGTLVCGLDRKLVDSDLRTTFLGMTPKRIKYIREHMNCKSCQRIILLLEPADVDTR